jgi:uncharacterized membrane protein HdeD (DUF308 family)
MRPTDPTARIVAGVAFLLGAAVLFAGVVTLGSPTTTTAVATVDLLVGLALVGSAVRARARPRTTGSRSQ